MINIIAPLNKSTKRDNSHMFIYLTVAVRYVYVLSSTMLKE